MGELTTIQILPTHRVYDIVKLHGVEVAEKQIKTALTIAQELVGEIQGADHVITMIREDYFDLTTEDLNRVARKLLRMDFFGKPTARHIIKAIELVEEEKSYELEERNNRQSLEANQPYAQEVMKHIDGIGHPREFKWTKIRIEDLMTLEDLSALNEQEKKARHLAKEWFTERAKWAKENGKKLEDYPTSMEQYVNDKLSCAFSSNSIFGSYQRTC